VNLPWYIHTLSRIYSPHAQALTPNGWAQAVAQPYTAGRLKAAWWVLTGRAYAFQWPEPGELELAARRSEPQS
jgi:hypothetical protein